MSGNNKRSSLSSVVILNLKQNDTKPLFTSQNSGREERNDRFLDFSSTLLKIIAMCSGGRLRLLLPGRVGVDRG